MAETLVIRVNRQSTDRLLRQLREALSNETQDASTRGIIVRRTARELQEEMQQKLLTGGHGKWPRTSRLTRGRHGRDLALQPLAALVKTRFKRNRAEIIFDSPSPNWNLTQHHEGFSVPETTANMRIPQLQGGAIYLKKRRPFHVPARPVWPSERTAVTVLNRNIRRFISHLEHGSSTTFGPAR